MTAARQVDAIAGSSKSAAAGRHALGDLMQPVRLVAEANAEATREIAHFRLTEARRQGVNIPVSARSAAWTGLRSARIVDLSATGARIEGLAATQGSELQLTFLDAGVVTLRRAQVKRRAEGDGGPWVGVAFVGAG